MESARATDPKLRTADIIAEAEAELDERIAYARERFERCRRAVSVAVDAQREFPRLVGVSTEWYRSGIYLHREDFNPTVRIRTVKLDDLRDVLPLVRYIAAKGYTMTKQFDVPENGYRAFYFHDRDDEDVQHPDLLHVYAVVGSDGARCRVVDTGETRPVRKIVCDGEPVGELEGCLRD